jgi:hypothetical protein
MINDRSASICGGEKRSTTVPVEPFGINQIHCTSTVRAALGASITKKDNEVAFAGISHRACSAKCILGPDGI